MDGKKIAEDIKQELTEEVKRLGRPPRLDIFYVGENPVIENFLRIKERMGREIGAETFVRRFPENISEVELCNEIASVGRDEKTDGIVVQLPLPKGFGIEKVLNTVPVVKDIDVLSQAAFEQFASVGSNPFPPVAGAVKEILGKGNISLADKKVLMLGNGRLVGQVVGAWLSHQHRDFQAADVNTKNTPELLRDADIIISGIGSPGFIKPDMIQDGVVLIDAGTAEQGGKVAGDADPACAAKCSLFTPVPGGVGPITVAILFRNLVHSSR